MPDAFRLSVVVAGYECGEAHIDPRQEPERSQQLVVALRKAAAVAQPDAHARVTCTITAAGRPVSAGWVARWWRFGGHDTVNMTVRRGCPVADEGRAGPAVPITADGTVAPRRQSGLLCVVVPGHPLHVLAFDPPAGATTMTLELPAAATLRGRVIGAPATVVPHLRVVAFNEHGVLRETRVQVDGTFAFGQLQPGTYALRAGHDCFPALMQAWSRWFDWNDFDHAPDPLRGACTVTLRPGEARDDLTVAFPRE